MNTKEPDGGRVRKIVLLEIAICICLLLFAGWGTINSFIHARTGANIIFGLLFAAITVFITVRVLSQINQLLHFYDNFLDAIPFPVVLMDQHMDLCFENKAAQETIEHELYFQNKLFKKIPDNYAITEQIVCRMEYKGAEYHVTLTPVTHRGLVGSYVVSFYSINGLLENYTSRSELVDEINRLLRMLNSISASFTSSTSALARCTQQQALSMYTVASIVSDAVSAGDVEKGNLQALQEAVATISSCIEEGGAHAREISGVAGDIVTASQSLSNAVKTARNIVE